MLEEIRSEMQVFPTADNAALGKMPFHLCKFSTGIGAGLHGEGNNNANIQFLSKNLYLYDLNAQTAILNISVGA